MRQTKKCTTCGKFFVKKVNVSRRNWELSRYCSNKCRHERPVHPMTGRTWQMSEEQKEHLRNVLKGKTCNTGRTHIKKGQHLSPDTEIKKGQTSYWKGKPNPHFAGPNNPRWKGGITPEHLKVRWSKKSKDFRDKIFKRDGYTCKSCGRSRKIGDRVILNVHHIKSFAIHKELRFDENNVITLCKECHVKTDTYGRNI